MPSLHLVTIADGDNDTYTLVHSESGNPITGRHGVVSAVRDGLLASGTVDSWLLRGPDGWYDVRAGRRVDVDVSKLLDVRRILFDPLRHFRDRSAMFRAEHGLDWPIVTMAHSIGYGPWSARGHADLLWNAGPQDLVIFPSSASRIAWMNLTHHLLDLADRTYQSPRQEVIPYHLNATSPQPSQRAHRGEAPTLLTIGRLDPIEKFDFIAYAKACRTVQSEIWPTPLRVTLAGRERSPDSTLWIAAIFRQHAPDVAIDILCNVEEERKWELYRSATALVHPSNSHAESFGLVLVEAAQSRLPIVATDFSGQREAVGDYPYVRFVTGRWRASASDTLDSVMQYGRMPGGTVDVEGLAAAISWSLSQSEIDESSPERSAPFVEALLKRLLDRVPLSSPASRTRDLDGGVDPFFHYWPTGPLRSVEPK